MKIYEIPELEVLLLDTADVICDSNDEENQTPFVPN